MLSNIQPASCTIPGFPGLQHTDTRQSPPLAPSLPPTDACSGGGCHLKPAAQQDCVGLTVQQAASTSMAVRQETHSPWFERMMPKPVKDIACQLLPDPILKKTLQDPQASVALYHQEVNNRETTEAKNGEYCFAPLKVTLHNMEKLTVHMLDNAHFPQPLAPDERDALLALQMHIRRLIVLGAPYQRTVQLALLMCILQEIMTERHVIAPLRETQSPLWRQGHLTTGSFWHERPGCLSATQVDTAGIPLEEALRCHWNGMNGLGQPDANSELSIGPMTSTLMRLLEERRVFLYPSFAPLDVADFCGFGHLPVYPLGMMSAHALNADGEMHTPLAFFRHDAFHAGTDPLGACLDGTGPLENIQNRLGFQQLVRGSLPGALHERLNYALEMVLFFLFHEEGVARARSLLEHKSFLGLFRDICRVRRRENLGYSPAYRAVTDAQALLACVWVYRVYTHCCAYPHEPGISANSLVSRFIAQDALPLLEHQRFLDRHREVLHEYFRAGSRAGQGLTGSVSFWYQTQGPAACAGGLGGEQELETIGDGRSTGLVRNTDLIYFNCLLDDEECTRMEQQLKVSLPAGRPHGAPD
ncbi:MAG: hypothetical protein OXC07_01100 [Kistimonas sp.]|nr:hypothetical protein [Kistimonas sp.]